MSSNRLFQRAARHHGVDLARYFAEHVRPSVEPAKTLAGMSSVIDAIMDAGYSQEVTSDVIRFYQREVTITYLAVLRGVDAIDLALEYSTVISAAVLASNPKEKKS